MHETFFADAVVIQQDEDVACGPGGRPVHGSREALVARQPKHVDVAEPFAQHMRRVVS